MYWPRFFFEMISGLLISAVLTAAFYLAKANNIAKLEKFTRNRVIGLIIALPALFACVPHAQIVAPGFLQNPVVLWGLAIAIPILSYFYIDYYTARAFGGALIILAYDLLHYAYDEQFTGAAVIAIFSWLFGFGGIWMSGKPHALRDWFRKAAANRKFAVCAAAAAALTGSCFLYAMICGLAKVI